MYTYYVFMKIKKLKLKLFFKFNMESFKEATIIYGAWIIVHHVASNLYVKLCTPNTILGFIVSPLMVNTPQCVGLRWVVVHGSSAISTMWTMAGLWIIKHIKFQ